MRIQKRGPSQEERAVLESQPRQEPAEAAVLMCWHDLHSCRPIGPMGAGAIPWTAIMEWARVHQVDREESIVLADAIRHLDAARAERLASERNLNL